MARPIRETPVLKGEDAFNFEMRRLEVEHMSKDEVIGSRWKKIRSNFPPKKGTPLSVPF